MENEAFKQALGKIILQLRSNRGISQERLALDAEVDRTRVGEIERGEANVTIDTLNRIAGVLGQKYSGAVSNIVTKAIAQASDFVQNKDTAHPDLFNPYLARNHPDWSLEMKASNQIAKGGESHNPGKGWFMIVIYQIVEGQTYIVQVEIARLETEDWIVHERGQHSNRTRTAVTIADATSRLRRNSIYVDPNYLTPALKKAILPPETRGR